MTVLEVDPRLPRHHPMRPSWWRFERFTPQRANSLAFGVDCDGMELLCDCPPESFSCVLSKEEIQRRFAEVFNAMYGELDQFLEQLGRDRPRHYDI